MKRLLNIKILYLLVLLVVMSSCNDLLEQYPYNQIPEEKAIESIEDAQTALTGVYAQLMTSYWGESAILLGDVLTDNCFPTKNYASFKDMSSYTFSPRNGEVSNLWLGLYATINASNKIVNEIDGLKATAKQRRDIKGQALALRAYAYMELTKWFSPAYSVDKNGLGVPIVLKRDNDARPIRASLENTYNQIEKDLLAAEELLVDRVSVASNGASYVSLWAVKSFLARFYLYKGEYQKAAAYATDVISSNRFGIYSSVSDLKQMLKEDKAGSGSEIIFQSAYTKTSMGKPLNKIYFDIKAGGRPKVDFVPSMRLISLYKEFGPANAAKFGPEDIRFREGVYFSKQQTMGNWEALVCYKYPGNPDLLENANMPKVIRLPELYLIRAEANCYLGKDKEAREDYNALRKKRIENYTDETTLFGDKLKQEIFNERMRELCFEGFYWFDLKRAGKGFEKNPTMEELAYVDGGGALVKVPAGNHRWLLPIPASEINGNPDIQKNPGY